MHKLLKYQTQLKYAQRNIFQFATDAQQIVYSFDAQAQNKDYWVDNPPFFQCDDGQYIFGKFNMNGVLIVNYQTLSYLPISESTLILYFIGINLLKSRIDSWDNDQFTIYLDNQLLFEQAYTYTTGTSNLCGVAAYNDEKIQISFQAQHNSNFAVVAMKAQDVNGDNNELWGIRAFTLSIEPCRSNFSIINLSNLECLYVLSIQKKIFIHFPKLTEFYKMKKFSKSFRKLKLTKTSIYFNNINQELKQFNHQEYFVEIVRTNCQYSKVICFINQSDKFIEC